MLKAETHKILYLCKTRWLVFEMVARRMLEQWEPLLVYFEQQAKTTGKEAENLFAGLCSLEMRLYYSFLGFILPIVNNMNVEFQSEEVRTIQQNHVLFLCIDVSFILIR